MSNVGLFLTQAIHGHWRTSQGRIQKEAQTIEKIGNDKDKNLYSILDFKN